MIPGLLKPMNGDQGYTTAEAARHLGVSANHVRDSIAAKKIRATNVGVRRVEYRISEEEVERLLAARRPKRVLGRPKYRTGLHP